MIVTIKTFNGHNINDGSSYKATGVDFNTRPGATLGFVNQANGDPSFAGVYIKAARNIPLEIQITNYANRDALDQQLKKWMDPGNSGYLVATLDDGADYQINCTVQAMTQKGHYANVYTVILQSGPSTWMRVTAQTDTWNASDGALTKVITVAGECDTKLSLSLTAPSAGGSGWQYQYLYKLLNMPGYDYGARPWEITVDTAAMVSAGHLRADCFDLRIIVNGVEAKRWISDPNTNHSHVWFTPTIGAGQQLKLAVAVPATGYVGELQFKSDADNLAALKALPDSGLLAHGTEWIQYSGKDLHTKKVGVVTMGALGTTRQVHNIGDIFKFAQNVIYMLAGNAAAGDPAATDATYDYDKPVFDLSQSDNTTWVYTASTVFYDAAHPTRPGSWAPIIKDNGNLSTWYEFSQNSGSGAPALGGLMACWQKGVTWQKDTAEIYWRLYCPAGFATVTATGSKYRSTARWPGLAAIQGSNDLKLWTSVWTESTPVNPTTWTAFSHGSTAITPAKNWLQAVLYGSMNALDSAVAYFEMLTVTVTFTSANLPTWSISTEAGAYPMAVRISNQANGDAIELLYPPLLTKTMILDAEAYTATYDGVNVHGAMKLNDESRDVWIRLVKGSNTLQIAPLNAGDSIGTLTIGLSWLPRKP